MYAWRHGPTHRSESKGQDHGTARRDSVSAIYDRWLPFPATTNCQRTVRNRQLVDGSAAGEIDGYSGAATG